MSRGVLSVPPGVAAAAVTAAARARAKRDLSCILILWAGKVFGEVGFRLLCGWGMVPLSLGLTCFAERIGDALCRFGIQRYVAFLLGGSRR